MEAFKTAGKF